MTGDSNADQLDEDPWAVLMFVTNRERVRDLWAGHRVRIMAFWLRTRPGSRPWAWWCFDAPRFAIRPGELAHRQLLSGGGAPDYPTDPGWFGLPSRWRGAVCETPPVFESEASFLRRAGLLNGEELRRVPPGGFEPVTIRLEALAHDSRISLQPANLVRLSPPGAAELVPAAGAADRGPTRLTKPRSLFEE